jgi:hypothetical protein
VLGGYFSGSSSLFSDYLQRVRFDNNSPPNYVSPKPTPSFMMKKKG